MRAQTEILPSWGNAAKVSAIQASSWLRNLLNSAGINEMTLAHGIDMSESQINRIKSARGGYVKTCTLRPLIRAAILINEVRKTLSRDAVHPWLTAPNPYLNDLPPILCLRSDKELEKAKSLLVAVRYGVPA